MLLFLMAIAPALPWRATSGEVLQQRLLPSAIAGVATMVLTVLLWTRDWTTVVAFGLAAFTLTAITRETLVAVRARRRAERTGRVRALGRTYAGNPRRYGGLVVHTGVVAIAVVLAAGGSFGTKQEVRLTRGQQASVGGLRHHLRRPAGHTQRAEERGRGRPQDRARRRSPRHVRAGDLHVPELHRGDRHAVGAHRAARGPLPHARLVTQRGGPDHRRRADPAAHALALDRRCADGDRHRDRARAARRVGGSPSPRVVVPPPSSPGDAGAADAERGRPDADPIGAGAKV